MCVRADDRWTRRLPDNLLMLGFGPRVWLCTIGLMVLGFGVRTMSPGLEVSGHLSATDTEREEQMVGLGNDILIQIRDKAIYERQIEPLIGSDVRLILVAK